MLRHIDYEMKYIEAKQLLKEAVEFMNKVPNHLITVDEELAFEQEEYKKTINHYELCNKINKFLKEG